MKSKSLSGYKAEHGSSPMFVLMLLISVSYWYCLPVVTQSFFAYNEFRVYDVLLMVLIVLLLVSYKQQLNKLLRLDKVARAFYRFCLWTTATYPLTILVAWLNHDKELPFVTLIFLFHLWGFMFGYAGFRIFVTTRKQCLLLLDVFLLAGVLEGLIICFQSLALLPRFWSSLYDVYGEMAFSGTLGPNRQVPGHTMLLVFVVAVSYWRNAPTVRVHRLLLALSAAMLSFLGLGISGSRTAWVALAVFVLALAILHGLNLKIAGLVVLLVATSYFVVPGSLKNRMGEMYNYRVNEHLDKHLDDGGLAAFQSVDSGRYNLWTRTTEVLLEKPWLIPFGGGFNTFLKNMQVDVSAHNIYLNLIAEVGIVGLGLYLFWFYAMWSESTRLIKMVKKRQERQSFQPREFRALLVAMLVSLFAGEILSTRRPSFAFLGMFLFLAAVMNQRPLVFGAEESSRSLLLSQRLLWRARRAAPRTSLTTRVRSYGRQPPRLSTRSSNDGSEVPNSSFAH